MIILRNNPAVVCAFQLGDCHIQNHSLPIMIKPTIYSKKPKNKRLNATFFDLLNRVSLVLIRL